jgi:hypothetical protein
MRTPRPARCCRRRCSLQTTDKRFFYVESRILDIDNDTRRVQGVLIALDINVES